MRYDKKAVHSDLFFNVMYFPLKKPFSTWKINTVREEIIAQILVPVLNCSLNVFDLGSRKTGTEGRRGLH